MYKVFTVEEIAILNGSKFAGNSESVRKNLAGTEFITQLSTGEIPLEGENYMNVEEARALMSNVEWSNEII